MSADHLHSMEIVSSHAISQKHGLSIGVPTAARVERHCHQTIQDAERWRTQFDEETAIYSCGSGWIGAKTAQ